MKKISLFLAAVMILFCITPVLEGQAAENSVYQTIFEDSFDTQGSLEHWKFVDNKNADAVMTVEEGALRVSGYSQYARMAYTGGDVTLSENTKYRVSYRTKMAGNASYYLGLEVTAVGKWQLAENGAYTASLYDNAAEYRGGAKNGSEDWTDVSYEFSVYGLQDTAGAAVDSITIPTDKLFLFFAGAGNEFLIDSLKIERVRPKQEPEFYSVSLGSAPMEGADVSAVCEYTDIDGLVEQMTYVWQMSDDNQTWTDLPDTSVTCHIPAESQGKYLRVILQWFRKGSSEPEGTIHSEGKLILSARPLPSVGEISLSESNGEITAAYEYLQSEGGKEEGESLFEWQLSQNGTDSWETLSINTSPVFAPMGLTGFIRVAIVPKDSDGAAGEMKYSAPLKITQDTIVFYVAPDGKTDGTGSFHNPFAQPEQARDAIRALKERGLTQDVIVYFRGGEYLRDDTFVLDGSDSGTADCHITYASYPGEKAVFTGGRRVPAQKITKVTDQKILDRVIDKSAAEQLMQIDLSDFYDEIPALPEYSHVNEADQTANDLFASQVQVYINGTALTQARWPNQGESELTIAKAETDADGISVFTFTDQTNRIAKWSDEALEDLFYEGHPSHYWTYSEYQIGALNRSSRQVTLKNPHQLYLPKAGTSFYFKNLIEEIDVPGESYIDRKNKMVYFYPFLDMEDAEVIVPVSQKAFLVSKGAKNVTIKDIDFEYVRNSMFDVSADQFVIDGCQFKYFTKRSFLDGSKNVFRNNFVYSGAAGGMTVSGGDVNSLESTDTVLENNLFDSTYTLRKAYAAAIIVSGCGITLKNNEICNGAHALIRLSGKNHIVTGNEIHHGVMWGGDMAAIYWGRTPISIGYEITNNYFHHNGSAFANGWQQSVFWDDGAIGPKIEGNIFYQGTYPNGTGDKKNFAVKTYGGQYSLVKNNIFVDNPYAVQFQNWGIRWWLALRDKEPTISNNWWKYYVGKGQLLTEAHQQYYAGTQWEAYLNSIDLAQYEKIKDLDPSNADDYAKLTEIANQNYDPATNKMIDNVIIKSANPDQGLYADAAGTETNSYIAATDLLPSGNSMFVEYGKDFALTPEGLAAVREKIPDFQNIDTESIGITAYETNGITKIPGGYAPTVSNVQIGGEPREGGTLTAQYQFEDQDGDKQGNSEICWYAVSSKDVKTELGRGLKLDVSSALVGETIVYSVTPVDENGRVGEETWSEPVSVSFDMTSADQVLENAKKKAAEAVVGTEAGTYPQSSVTALQNAITKAEQAIANASSQQEVDQAIATLEKAIKIFELSANGSVSSSPSSTPVLPVTPGISQGGSYGGITGSIGNRNNGTTSTPAASRFSDMAGHWAEADVTAMADKGIVFGVTDTLFEPERPVTRAEFSAFIVRALHITGGEAAGFTDVEKGAWYEASVNAAANAGLLRGYDGQFRPNDMITREEMAVVIVKAFLFRGKETSQGQLDRFADREEIADWAAEYVDQAVSSGLIAGMTADTFAPKENGTRAQAISLIRRMLEA
ncbi:MAG: S-layer homology domain-containing protein [Clostridia bacterium]|nr:S-layer homology domain-containing protein [Clostridia bacterium]